MPVIDSVLKLHPRCRQNAVALDTEVLTLFVVGCLDRRRIASTKRTNKFEAEDFGYLQELVGRFPSLLVTAGTLAETCNLLDSENRRMNFRIFNEVRGYLEGGGWSEVAKTALDICRNAAFPELGFTDALLCELATQNHLIITVDAGLTAYLLHHRLPVLNLFHERGPQ